MLTKFVLKTDFTERIMQTESELWDEIAKKQDKSVFTKQFEQYEQDAKKYQERISKDIRTLRELFDRMRCKTDESIHSLVEIRQEVDAKMTSKEG